MQETQETQVWSLRQEDPLEEENGNLLQYSCLKNPMDQRSLVGYNPKGHKESDMTKQLSMMKRPAHWGLGWDVNLSSF